MKTRPQIAVFFLLAFMLLVSLACLSSTPTPDATATSLPPQPTEPQPTVPPIQAPTNPPQPTTPPMQELTAIPTEAETEVPTEEPAAESEPYYTEEFDVSPENWSYFMMSGKEDDMDIYTEDGQLIFDLRGPNQYVYLLYDDYYYEDVYIEAQAENRGQNTNNVSLICRYTDEEGWYEFNVTNGGLYNILAYSEYYGEYRNIYNGGSKNIKSGWDTNVYSATCIGNELSLYINGVLERTVEDTKFKFKEGQVGVGVSSFEDLPILVKFDYVMIDVP
jgi:hypothetical protein